MYINIYQLVLGVHTSNPQLHLPSSVQCLCAQEYSCTLNLKASAYNINCYMSKIIAGFYTTYVTSLALIASLLVLTNVCMYSTWLYSDLEYNCCCCLWAFTFMFCLHACKKCISVFAKSLNAH